MSYKFKDLHPVIQEKMLDKQEEQTGYRDASIFEKNIKTSIEGKGFRWGDDKEPEKHGIDSFEFWSYIIETNSLEHFSKVYPVYKAKTTKEVDIKFLTKKP